MSLPTKLKKMKLNSVDFVRRGANPEAHIAIAKSDSGMEDDEVIDIAKAEQDLTLFTDALGESFSSIMKDDSLDDEERFNMIQKSRSEFNDTLDSYMRSLGILEYSSATNVTKKSSETRKGDDVTMANYFNVDKSLLSPEEALTLDALIAKACKTEKSEEELEKERLEKEKAGKVNPAAAQGEMAEKEDLPPEVKKALQEVEEMKKSYEMRELEGIAKKYEVLGKKSNETAKTLYDLKKSGQANYDAYVALLDEQVSMVEKSGIFTEIGKSGNFNYSSVAKSEPETKIEAIAKGYMEKDPAMDYDTAIAKAWENNPDLMDAYDAQY